MVVVICSGGGGCDLVQVSVLIGPDDNVTASSANDLRGVSVVVIM